MTVSGYLAVFAASFVGSVVLKLKWKPGAGKYKVKWNDSMGTIVKDLPYGEKSANKFDLYLPAKADRQHCALVVYLHAGGFTQGDKADDHGTLEWLCSKGYVACGINYTLYNKENPDASVYSQTLEIKKAMPVVIAEAAKRGYIIDRMAIGGGSAGCALALIYAYRDRKTAPVPVKVAYGGVGPSSFYPEDWGCFGFDKPESREAAAAMFGVMAGKQIDPAIIGTPAYDEAMKDISALLWVDDDCPPTVLAYGSHDKMQSFPASVRLDRALSEHHIPHEYIVCPHSGHGMQNDTKLYFQYLDKIEEYLERYLAT